MIHHDKFTKGWWQTVKDKCESKTRSGNAFKERWRAAELASQLSLRSGGQIQEFLCHWCGRFHIGRHNRWQE